MKVKDIGEFEFIKKVTGNTISDPENIIRSVGDDAAVYKTESDKVILITTDILMEDIHFMRNKISPADLGHKAIAVNLSDIAAMGAKPEHAVVSLAIPDDLQFDYLETFYTGLKKSAEKYKVNIIGGDTSGSKSGFVINIALTGSAHPDKILYRNKAMPGDYIFSTGIVGNSKAGLHVLLNNTEPQNQDIEALINSHNRPYPYIDEGIFLAQCRGVHAAIDVSDGLDSDLGHIANESNTGFILYEDAIPVSDEFRYFCKRYSFNPVDYAISGGEDYVLLFTADPEHADSIEKSYRTRFRKNLYKIGKITAKKEKLLIKKNGESIPLQSTGWDHFKL